MKNNKRKIAWFRNWTWRTLIKRGLLGVALLLLLLAGFVHLYLRSSLPILSGHLNFDELAAEVLIERDAAGVPTITASDRSDTAFALGFLHAQERFFQMDILRRISSGRLSELLGSRLIETDQRYRKHQFQQAASVIVEKMPENHRKMFRAYCNGVNRGLAELTAMPFEYSLLRAKPAKWTELDCIHVIQSMLTDLQRMDGDHELGIGLLQERVPEEVYNFLVRDGSSWDAAMDGTTIESLEIPGEEIWSLREAAFATHEKFPEAIAANDGPILQALFPEQDPEAQPGSNNWAVSSAVGKNGRAILASDMHLGLRVPATWYRAVMKTPCLDGKSRRLVGVTLPGIPGLVEGSNGDVAWGMTNSRNDFGDIIELVNVPSEDGTSNAYMTPNGPIKIEHCVEKIKIGDTIETIEYEQTIWGPVVAKEGERRFVHHWIGDDPGALDTLFFEMETAGSTGEAMELCNRSGMIQLNVVVADRDGSIGWTLCGRLARRAGGPSRTIQDWSESGAWQGYLLPEEYPRVQDPANGRVWTANNRVVGGAMMNLLGNSGLVQGGRAHQIRKRLIEQDSFDEQDMLEIQLDDEALFLVRWQKLLLQTAKHNPNSVSAEFVKQVENWEQRASTNSVGYRIVRSFRSNTGELLLGLDIARVDTEPHWGAITKKADIKNSLPLSIESIVWDLITKQPMHWLPAEFESWDQLLVHAASTSERLLTADGPIGEATWGAKNEANLRHPLSSSIPWVASWLDMPKIQLPGDVHMPRVQGQNFGASQRMVVSPGFEEEGIYHQPGGQSGHPYSPYYRAGYKDWCEGKASPLLPGPTKYTLKFSPKQ